MLDPEFLEWLNEGTPEEKVEKKRKFVAHIREHPEMYGGDAELLDKYEQSIGKYEAINNKGKWLELEKAAAEYEKREADRELDETLLNEEHLPIIPLFGKPKKDSH